MAAPRNTLVTLYVQGTAATDITDDLLEFSWTQIQSEDPKGSSLEVKVRDTDLKYRNQLFIKKGTQVIAEVAMLNWGGGTTLRSPTGTMWVDTVEMTLRPRTMTFKATSVAPWMEKQGRKHKGTEGKNSTDIAKDNFDKNQTFVQANGSEDPSEDPAQKRADQENESDLAYHIRKGKEVGKSMIVKDGKYFYYREADIEAQAPFMTISDGVTPLISGSLRTTNVGKFKKGKISYIDPKTGKKITKEVEVELDPMTNATPPTATLNSRERPNFPGKQNVPGTDPTTPIGKGTPGDPGD